MQRLQAKPAAVGALAHRAPAATDKICANTRREHERNHLQAAQLPALCSQGRHPGTALLPVRRKVEGTGPAGRHRGAQTGRGLHAGAHQRLEPRLLRRAAEQGRQGLLARAGPLHLPGLRLHRHRGLPLLPDAVAADALARKAFYHLELARFSKLDGAIPDNPDQRISEDVNQFTSYSVTLTMGLLNAVVTLASFVGILWTLSGSFGFHFDGREYVIPGFMVWMAVAYALAGSVIAHYVGRSLIGLNFRQQRVEADFRHHMVRVREYSESIALDQGEAVERQQIGHRFTEVLANYLQLLKRQKALTWFTVGYGQAAVVFPFIVAAPRFFSGAIQLGELMQVASAFGRVQVSLSWFVDNYDRLAAWRATTDRLTSFEESFVALKQHASGATELRPSTDADTLLVDSAEIRLPDGTLLISAQDLALHAGQHVLVKGPSGSGKSTLFRTLAGVWPWARAKLARPADFAQRSMFLPQRPYFPNGSLREALAYPATPERYTEAQLQQALRDALLPQLADQLDREDAWGQKLSGGEQQRLAIARALLKQPRWLFVDEASSALDEEAERVLYQRLRELVAEQNGALISIAHRPGVAAFHEHQWSLEGDASLGQGLRVRAS